MYFFSLMYFLRWNCYEKLMSTRGRDFYLKLAKIDKGGRGFNFDQKLVDVIKLPVKFN